MNNVTEDEIKALYRTNFNLKDYCMSIQGEFSDINFIRKSLAQIFMKPNIQGSTLLEIGSGPVIPHIGFAAKRFSHIILSDFLQSSIDSLKSWLANEKDAYDWTDFLKTYAEAQGYEDVNSASLEMESLIRANVKEVIPCDILADQIVPDQYNKQYDAVLSCRVLEGVCLNYTTYKKCLKKISTLVKLNGHLILMGYFDSTVYTVGNNRFPVLPLTHKEVQMALEEAGFQDIEWKFFINKEEHIPGDRYYFGTSFCLCCVKTTEEK